MSLLTIVTTACAEMSLVQPAAVAGSTDRQVQQLMALVNLSGATRASEYPWQALREEFHFNTVAQASQTNAIPNDFDRWVPNSFFNRTTRRGLTGPLTPRQWQWMLAQPVFSTVYLSFVERQGALLMAPTPPAGQAIYGEYVSINWAKSAGGASQPSFALDSDLTYLNERLLIMDLKWRFKLAKGLDYAEDMADAERFCERLQARDGGATALTLAPQPVDPSRINLPDGNFGS